MAGEKISTQLELTGEKQYSNAIKAINNDITLFSAQLKSLTSEMHTNGSSVYSISQQYALMQQTVESSKQKIETLNSAISANAENQTKIADALASAKQKQSDLATELEKTKQQYGASSEEAKKAQEAYDKNASTITRLQNSLANAEKTGRNYQIQLANAETQLNRNTSALKRFESENGIAVSSEQQLANTLKQSDEQSKMFNAQIQALASSYDSNGKKLQNLRQQQQLYQDQVSNSETKVSALSEKVKSSEQEWEHLRAELARMQVRYGDNSTQAQIAAEALRQNEQQLTSYRTQLANAETELNNSRSALQNFNNENGRTKIAQTFNAAKDSVKAFVDNFKQSHPVLAQVASSAKDIAVKVKDIAVKAAEISFKAAETGAKAFGKTVETSMSAGLKAVEGYTTALATATVGIGTWAAKTGAEFDSQMSTVAAISGANAEQLQDLTNKAKEMGETTSFSAAESAKAFEYMAMAGWKTDEMLGGISGVINLAAASGEDLATVSDIVTDAMTAFGMSADRAGDFADVLAKTASSANTDVGTMGETFKYVAPLAGTLGYNIEDMSVAIGLMANAGIKGSNSGTALRSIISNLAAPTNEVTEAMQELGISLTNQDGSTKSFEQTVKELRSSFAGLSETEQTAYASTIAGQRGMSGLLAIVNSSDKDFADLTNEINNSKDAAEKMAKVKLDNLQGDITLLKSNVEGLALDTSGKLNPALREIVKRTNNLVTLFKIGGINGVISGINSLLPGIIKKAQSLLSDLLPVLTKGFNSLLLTLAGSISQFLPTVTNTIIPSLTTATTDLVTGIVQLLPTLLPELANGAVALFQGIIDGLNQVADTLAPMLPQIVTDLMGTLLSSAPQFFDSSLEFFTTLLTSLADVSNTIMPMLPQLVSDLCDTLLENIDEIIDAGFDLLIGLADGIIACIPILLLKLPKIIKKIQTTLTSQENLKKMIDTGKDLIVAVAEGLPKAITTLISAIPEITSAIVNTLMETDWIQVGKDISNGIKNGFMNIDWSFITEFKDNWLLGIKDSFDIGSPSKLMKKQVGNFLALGISDGFTSTMDEQSKTMIDSVNDIFKDGISTDIPSNIPVPAVNRAYAVEQAINSANPMSSKNGHNYGDININISIPNARIDSQMDIRRTAEELAVETRRNLIGLGLDPDTA